MTEQPPHSAATRNHAWYRRIGPGLITACVVIGPGSILTSSQVGARYGYQLAWVVIIAAFFMSIYMTMAARLGVVAQQSTAALITRRAGRWLAVLIGLGVFFISAVFQFGNNLGVHAAFAVYVDFPYVIVIFNALAILFLFSFRNLYRAVERLMMVLVALMLAAFAINLGFARPTLGSILDEVLTNPFGVKELDISVFGLVGTTFVISAAYYQTYLVRQKGWSKSEMASGLVDARIGAIIMALITLMIMTTAATVLRDQELANISVVAKSLEPSFGRLGQFIFCLGLFAAAYSSFLINSMIGGFIVSDGLGCGDAPNHLGPRVFATIVLLVGMSVALYAIFTESKPVSAIVAAQAATVLAAPLMAGAIWWLTNCRDIMGDERNGWLMNVLAAFGFLLLLAIAWYTASQKIWPALWG